MKFDEFSPTPQMEVYIIADLIKNKIVCDLGSGDGKWLSEMNNFAKKTIGIEIDPKYTNIPKDFTEEDLSNAEVLFISMGEKGTRTLGEKLLKDKWHGTIISYGSPVFDIPKERRQTFLIYEI